MYFVCGLLYKKNNPTHKIEGGIILVRKLHITAAGAYLYTKKSKHSTYWRRKCWFGIFKRLQRKKIE